MAELHWGPGDYGPLTLREVLLVYQHSLESRWNFQSAILSEVHNGTIAAIRLNSKEKPPMTTPDDFNPCTRKRQTGTVINAGNFESTFKMMGDCFLAGIPR